MAERGADTPGRQLLPAALRPKLIKDLGSQTDMRYWAYFALKLAVAAAGISGLVARVGRSFPASKDPLAPLGQGASFLLCDLALMLCFLLGAGALYAIVHDQRYRCRVCL